MDDIAGILTNAQTIAVVGLSHNPMRPSYGVSEYMKRMGYRIIPVNPAHAELLGEKVYRTLEEIPEKIDIVNVFRRSEYVPPIVDSAIRIGAKAIWLQVGIEHDQAGQKARDAGLAFVQDRCIMVDHRRYLR